tara:strand:+ start:646 stop:1821 length:1176 start_codon:yes stop_codon:yes gene_type:complete
MNQENEFLKLAKLIASSFSESINEEDREYLDSWRNESKENQEIYETIIKDGWYDSNSKIVQKYKTHEGWNKISSKIQSNSKIKRLVPTFLKYAAMAIIFIGLGSLFKENIFSNEEAAASIIIKNIEPGTDKATLTLEDGSQIALEKGESFQTQNANSNGEEIIYEVVKRNTKEIAYNYLTIPRGGQFFIKLSDGTQVWLNSESQLKYPTSFIDGEERKVELIYGEAYFDVSPSTQHNGATFKVATNNQVVEVLGTEFNVKSYNGDEMITTTLVEGKVVIGNNSVQEYLSPGEQSKFSIKNEKIEISKVDIYNETSWKNGIFNFHKKPLKEIGKVLSRWYDVDIDFLNKEIEDVRFIGSVSKNQKIEDILELIKSTNFINDYDIIEKKIIIK